MKTATSAWELSKERVRNVTRPFDLHDCDALVDFSGTSLALKALPVRLPTQRSAVGVITLKNWTLSPTAERFLDLAQKTAKSLPKLPAPTPLSHKSPATRV